MPQDSLVDREGTPVDVAPIEPFVAAFRGSVVRSGDADAVPVAPAWCGRRVLRSED